MAMRTVGGRRMPGLKRARRLFVLMLLLGGWAGGLHAADVEVEIEGVEGPVLENVRAMLSIVGDRLEEDAPERSIRRLHRRAPDEIRRALEPFGYYAPTIDTRLSEEDGAWTATYRIEPGERVRLAEVTIEIRGQASDDKAFADLRDDLALRADEPLVHSDYDDAKQRIMELAASRGYFDAAWERSTLRIDPAAREARAALILDSGPRYALGHLRGFSRIAFCTTMSRSSRAIPGRATNCSTSSTRSMTATISCAWTSARSANARATAGCRYG